MTTSWGLDSVSYPDVDTSFEYIDMSNQNQTVKMITEMFTTFEADVMIKHLNIGGNLSLEETYQPRLVLLFFFYNISLI